MMDIQEFKGKVVLITGAGKGAGRRLAEAFARQGATVAANDISPINVEALPTLSLSSVHSVRQSDYLSHLYSSVSQNNGPQKTQTPRHYKTSQTCYLC